MVQQHRDSEATGRRTNATDGRGSGSFHTTTRKGKRAPHSLLATWTSSPNYRRIPQSSVTSVPTWRADLGSQQLVCSKKVIQIVSLYSKSQTLLYCGRAAAELCTNLGDSKQRHSYQKSPEPGHFPKMGSGSLVPCSCGVLGISPRTALTHSM